MADLRRFTLADLLLLLATVALAGGARAGYLVTCCDGGKNAGPLRVQDARPAVPGAGGATELDELVQNVKEDFSFRSRAPLSDDVEVTAHTSPGYPWTLGLLARFVEADMYERVVRWGQCGLGALTAGLYFLFARRAFGSRLVAGLAGLFCALHPFWVIDTAALDDGTLASFLLAAALLFGARGVQLSGAFSSLLYGLTLAGLALVRAALLPLAFVAVGWFLWRCRTVQRGWLCAILAVLGFANGLTPWTVRNWQVFHEPVPIVDSAYLHLWQGNHPVAGTGPLSETNTGSLQSPEMARLPQPRRYAELASKVLDDVTADPVGTVRRRLWAGLSFFLGGRWLVDGDLAEEVPGAGTMPDWLASSYPGAMNGTLLGMLVLGLLGWRWTYGWRDLAMPSSLALLWVPLPYFLSHAEALAGPRLPLDGVLLCYSAFALACFVPGVSGRLLAGARNVLAVREGLRR
jgi:4-amino-4-deoxy-L-arabinose transferase-like glycosyltransferase